MMREDVEHHQTVFHAATCRNLVTENHLLAVVMCAGVEEERAGSAPHRVAESRIALTVARQDHGGHCGSAAARLENGPTGKAARYLLHVFLRVTAINSERVQFHQLARVVFVDAASLLLLRPEDSRTTTTGIGTHALEVVEIKKHRRALGGRFEQLRKLRQQVWANGVAIV